MENVKEKSIKYNEICSVSDRVGTVFLMKWKLKFAGFSNAFCDPFIVLCSKEDISCKIKKYLLIYQVSEKNIIIAFFS